MGKIQNSKTRLFYVDNLRGLLILLVILGHCVQTIDIDFDHNVLFRYIYSFHMPLFMFISGYVSYKKDYKLHTIKHRFVQLIVPFIAWAMLDMTISSNWNLEWLADPDKGLWFLWVLFWIGSYFIATSILSKKLDIQEDILMAISCLIFIGILFISKLSFGFHLFAWYLPFYCMGAITMKYNNLFMPLLNKIKIALWVLFILGAFFWMRTEPPTFINSSSTAITFAYKFVVGTIGCFAFISIAPLFNSKYVLISELGAGMTLGIYAIHQPIISLILASGFLESLSIDNLWLQISTIMLSTILVTLAVYWCLSKTNITSKIFLGKSA